MTKRKRCLYEGRIPYVPYPQNWWTLPSVCSCSASLRVLFYRVNNMWENNVISISETMVHRWSNRFYWDTELHRMIYWLVLLLFVEKITVKAYFWSPLYRLQRVNLVKRRFITRRPSIAVVSTYCMWFSLLPVTCNIWKFCLLAPFVALPFVVQSLLELSVFNYRHNVIFFRRLYQLSDTTILSKLYLPTLKNSKCFTTEIISIKHNKETSDSTDNNVP